MRHVFGGKAHDILNDAQGWFRRVGVSIRVLDEQLVQDVVLQHSKVVTEVEHANNHTGTDKQQRNLTEMMQHHSCTAAEAVSG